MSLLTSRPETVHRVHPDIGRQGYVTVALLAAVLAGGIHAAVVPEHLAESRLVAVFFTVVALGQFGFAIALRRLLPVWVLVGTVVAHVGLIVLYVASRTVDLPFVPAHHPGGIEHLPVAGGVGNGNPIYPGARIEPVGLLDVVCVIAEVVLVAALCGLLPARVRSRITTGLLLLAILAVALRATALVT